MDGSHDIVACQDLRHSAKHGNYVTDMGNLTQKNPLELAICQIMNLTEADRVAAINSMITLKKELIDLNAENFARKGRDKKVVMVGAFRLWINLNPSQTNDRFGARPISTDAKKVLTDSAAEYVIPDCDLFIITSLP